MKRLGRTGGKLNPDWWAFLRLPDGRCFIRAPLYCPPYYDWNWGWVPLELYNPDEKMVEFDPMPEPRIAISCSSDDGKIHINTGVHAGELIFGYPERVKQAIPHRWQGYPGTCDFLEIDVIYRGKRGLAKGLREQNARGS